MPEFLFWPLFNLYWLKSPKTQVSSHSINHTTWGSFRMVFRSNMGRKGDQSWVFIGRTDADAETPILRPPHAKRWLIGKDPDAGRDWGQEEKGMTEDEMAGWHHRLDARESEWTPGVGDGQGGLACYDSWGHKESDTTERLHWTDSSGGLLGGRVSQCRTDSQPYPVSFFSLPDDFLSYRAPFINPFLLNTN